MPMFIENSTVNLYFVSFCMCMCISAMHRYTTYIIYHIFNTHIFTYIIYHIYNIYNTLVIYLKFTVVERKRGVLFFIHRFTPQQPKMLGFASGSPSWVAGNHLLLVSRMHQKELESDIKHHRIKQVSNRTRAVV